jgi:hypothetical protein
MNTNTATEHRNLPLSVLTESKTRDDEVVVWTARDFKGAHLCIMGYTERE